MWAENGLANAETTDVTLARVLKLQYFFGQPFFCADSYTNCARVRLEKCEFTSMMCVGELGDPRRAVHGAAKSDDFRMRPAWAPAGYPGRPSQPISVGDERDSAPKCPPSGLIGQTGRIEEGRVSGSS
jgi:hypothetical protein